MSEGQPPGSAADTGGVFHAGETAVQEHAGVREMAASLGSQMIQPRLDPDFAMFLRAQPFVVVASAAPSGRVSASILAGEPGFAAATSWTHIVVSAEIDDADPLAVALAHGPSSVGILVLDPMSRGRVRLNGLGERSERGLEVELREVFGNCPKYIQRRHPRGRADSWGADHVEAGDRLSSEQARFVGEADTFFIASRHPERGADASHRGGRPGFVQVSDEGSRLTCPDYRGNNMFQTLGNLTVEPAVGLLFIAWDSGRTLQISGQATVIWDDPRAGAWPGAQRLVDVEVDAVLDRSGGSAYVWEFVEASKVSPAAPARWNASEERLAEPEVSPPA
jgi:predicted pyridoxine 5'-phosphate oxidase superfamily flavin-nucleotide-binding protein